MGMDLVPQYEWASARFDSILSQIKEMGVEEQESWLCALGADLQRWDEGQDYVLMRQAEILYLVNSVWDLLSNSATSPWNHDFYCWAESFTKRRSKSQARITIANKIAVFRDWVAEKAFPMPEKVFVPKSDRRFGGARGVLEDDLTKEEDWEEVPFDPIKCDYAKLLVARAAARNGEMTDLAWTILQDPNSTVADLKSALNKDSQKKSKPKDDFRVWAKDGVLLATADGRTVPFAYLDAEQLEDPLALRAMQYLMQILGVDEPIGIINPPTVHGSNHIEFDGRTLKIYLGSQILEFNRAQAKRLADLIYDSWENDF